ncbi:hypothetical protein BDGGKGIB_00176 [Nodularia sphaerocarpa UHCC 0038]|nr:hypothetical protein BDGGKGIB_00176 [Nodularia sphaerocarpa UHCC 0038]
MRERKRKKVSWGWEIQYRVSGIGKTLSFPLPTPHSLLPIPLTYLISTLRNQFLTNQVVRNIGFRRNIGVAIDVLKDCIYNPVEQVDDTLVADGAVAV